MSHWIVAPVILPAMLAPIMAMAMRHDMVLQRTFGLAGQVALLCIAVGLAISAWTGTVTSYELGAWPAPFGIVLVLDRLSAMMLVLTALLGVTVTLQAIGSGWDRQGWHFHALFAFQMMGVNGAFLTGDIFNLFVFFEVLLIASYGLMIHSGGPRRLRAGLQYVVMNLAGSTLFLFALGTIYGTLGTLNMADLAEKAASIGPDNAAILAVAAVLLLIVFAVKAAAFPVQFWLPGTYSNAPAPVAALFAIMTKVGAYSIIRVYTLIFGESTPDVAALIQSLLIPAALLTLIVGAVGVLGARRLERMIAFSVLSSMGTLMIAIALFTETGLNAALYYLIHSTFATAGLFLVADLVRKAEAEGKPPHGLTVTLYFVAAVAMAGMPPLTGFLGKLFVLQATAEADWATIAWWVILVTSLLTIVGFTRMGSALFWKPATAPGPDAPETALPGGLATTATAIPLVVLTAVTLTSGPVAGAMGVTAAQLTARTPYIDAVLYPETRAGDRLIRGGGAYEPGGSHYKGDETATSADTTDASTEGDSTGSTH